MRPADALDRIVYLLDRSLAEPAKVRAFARARDVVGEVGDAEVERLHAAGSLTDLPGIGPSTGRVIAEALAGEVPGYLARLEEETTVPLGEGADLRAALRGDCHTHSTWSDGGASIERMARTAIDLGHEYMVLTDHSPRLTVAHGLDAARLRRQLAEVDALNERLAPFRILTGIEVDILEDGRLDQDEELLARLDVVVASVHSKLRMAEGEMTRRMVVAVASPHVDVLGHCTGRKLVGRGRPPSAFDAEVVFAACARFDTALEVNCRPERQDPPDDLLELAAGWGLRFAIDTDAHAPGQMEWQALGCDKAARHGIGADRVVNALAAEDLVAWAASHAP
ncbi:MAG TPA: PHP domain-containing protein [Acidimicrobiales bacterium]|nr:PHP domain-containing protein [Acidimicrobiales bacterium]